MKINSDKWSGQIYVAAALFACLALEAFATTNVVNQNDPTKYQTISSAVAISSPGDTILVYPGTYQESVTINGLFLRALRGPEVTVIQSATGTGDGVTINGSANVSVIGFRVQGFINGIMVNTTGGATKVVNCIATGNSAVGIYFSTTMPTGAQILNNIAADNGGDGFYTVTRSGYTTFTGVMNNIIYRNGGYGFNAAINYYNVVVFGDYNCIFSNNNGALSSYAQNGTHSITTDPLLDVTKYYRFSSQSSPCVNTGNHSTAYNDPDGSYNDMGAYGGPDAANWWRSPFGGPTVQNVTVDPPQVAPSGTVTIRATAVSQ